MIHYRLIPGHHIISSRVFPSGYTTNISCLEHSPILQYTLLLLLCHADHVHLYDLAIAPSPAPSSSSSSCLPPGIHGALIRPGGGPPGGHLILGACRSDLVGRQPADQRCTAQCMRRVFSEVSLEKGEKISNYSNCCQDILNQVIKCLSTRSISAFYIL